MASLFFINFRTPCCGYSGIDFEFPDGCELVACCLCGVLISREMLYAEARKPIDTGPAPVILRRERTQQICRGCQNEIDPDTCGCGTSRKGHESPFETGHSFVPMGCTCLMTKESSVDDEKAPKMIPWPFPWPKPADVYQSDGPQTKPGRQHDVVVCGVLFMVARTGDYAIISGRARYRVDCQDCNVILHENTTGVSARVREHLNEHHNQKVKW